MLCEFYINFKCKKAYGGLALAGAPKTSIKKPSVRADEVCVKMSIDIADILFEKPILNITGAIHSNLDKDTAIKITAQAKELIEKKLNLTCEIKE